MLAVIAGRTGVSYIGNSARRSVNRVPSFQSPTPVYASNAEPMNTVATLCASTRSLQMFSIEPAVSTTLESIPAERRNPESPLA